MFPQMKRSIGRILCSRRSMRLTRCSRIQRSVAATNIPHEPTKRRRRVVAHIHEVPHHAGLMAIHIVVVMMTARTKTCDHHSVYSSVHEGSEKDKYLLCIHERDRKKIRNQARNFNSRCAITIKGSRILILFIGKVAVMSGATKTTAE